ncbi:MAG: bifunctional adenosylcobinamide kinase/adenosylcobinamide-phosphate guanylyltransferase [Acidobacteriota bacterium]
MAEEVREELEGPESILITGGARSGKSRFAEGLAKPFDRVLYLATGEARDEEMAARIRRHRKRRPSPWQTLEEPLEVIPAVARMQGQEQVILIDCITLWVSNLLGRDLEDEAILLKVDALCKLIESPRCRILVVSNEVGLGIVPANPMARRFRDLTGTANQRLAQAASRVYWLVAGIPVRVK